jgi:hypothetical protein
MGRQHLLPPGSSRNLKAASPHLLSSQSVATHLTGRHRYKQGIQIYRREERGQATLDMEATFLMRRFWHGTSPGHMWDGEGMSSCCSPESTAGTLPNRHVIWFWLASVASTHSLLLKLRQLEPLLLCASPRGRPHTLRVLHGARGRAAHDTVKPVIVRPVRRELPLHHFAWPPA